MLTPWMVVEPIVSPPEGRQAMAPSSLPPIVWLFFFGFVAAAIICVSALVGKAHWREVTLAGAIPFAVAAWAIGGVAIELDRSGVPARDLVDVARMLGLDTRSFGQLAEMLGIGFYLHYGSALALVVTGLRMRNG